MKLYLSLFLSSLFFVTIGITVSNAQTDSAKSVDSATRVYVDPSEVVVTAVRTELRKSSVPFSVSTIESPSAGPDRSITPLLRGLPGLQVSDRFNYAVGERITNRGFGARTQFGVRGIRIVQDGIPLTFADGQSALESVDPQEIASVELLNGPGSSIYGNAAGGALLLKSFYADPYDLIHSRIVASASSGSNGLLKYSASSDGRVGDDLLLGGSFNHLAYQGFRNHSSARVLRAGIRAATDLNGDGMNSSDRTDLLTVNGKYTEFHALNPGALTQAEYDTNITIAAASSLKADARKDGHQSQIGASWRHGTDTSHFTLSTYAIGRSFTNPIVGKITDLSRIAGGAQAFYNARSVSPILWDWNIGAALDLMNDDRTSFANNSGQKGAINLDQNERVTTTAIFGSLSIAPIDALTAMLAARYDRVRFGVTDRIVNSKDPDDSGDRTMDAISPSFGLIWRALNELQVFANVSTSFETPTTTELSNRPSGAGGFNPDLEPQRATGFEAGVRGRLAWRFNYDITGYVTNIRGELVPFELPDAPGRSFYRNAGSARHSGVETSIDAYPFDSLELHAAFTYINARYIDYVLSGSDYSSNQVPGVAPTVLSVSATYHLPFGLNLSLEGVSNGSVYTNDANTVSADSYNVFNISLGTSGVHLSAIESDISVMAGAENLLNTRYVSSVVVNAAANRFFEPGSGRSFWASVSLRLVP
jgi:iron complex outermembrane receptor protein